MKFRVAASVLILTACATLSGAENQTDLFRVPGPEEIYEAFAEGFLDYQDYRELLEISRSDFLTPEDSAYLRQFPDLLAGLSSNAIFNANDDDVVIPKPEMLPSKRWRQSALIRQYERIDQNDRREQLYRISGSYDRAAYYGEMEHEYSGVNKWSRRYIQYQFAVGESRLGRIAIGNFKERLGLGLIYGYHGQLFSKSSERDKTERFLYPNYGGGNGILLTYGLRAGDIKMLYDTDRDDEHVKKVAAISVPFDLRWHHLTLSALHGRLDRRDSDPSEGVSMISISGRAKAPSRQVEWELAVADNHNRFPMAGAIKVDWRRRQMRLIIEAWSYDSLYPAYFCGGPSSHRSLTRHLDDLDFSYGDRYSGETGVVIKTSYPIIQKIRFNSAVGYTRRDFDDDRIETKMGLKRKVVGDYTAKIVCYWRSDHLYSDIRKQSRIQFEITRSGTKVEGRLVMGHRFEQYNDRRDYLLLAETKMSGRWGKLAFLGKFDRLQPNDGRNQYMYLTGVYETGLGKYLRSYIKYTYRYRRDEPANSYGLVRVDLKWIIE